MTFRPKLRLIAVLTIVFLAIASCQGRIPVRAFGTIDGVSRSSSTAPNGPLVFAAEFEDERDLALFGRCHWWNDDGCTIITNNELEWYVPTGVGRRGGDLALTAREQSVSASNGRAYEYTSGMVSTGPTEYQGRPLFAFTYGYVEVRAKIPAGKGLWPALWLLPASGEPLPEIDIIEFIGDATDTAEMHAHRSSRGEAVTVGESYVGPDYANGYHVYAVEWTPDHVAWIIDGVERFRVEGAQVPHEDMYFIANLAVGGNWPGQPNAETKFPAEFLIDYVRIWRS